jgi:hypothetical protein
LLFCDHDDIADRRLLAERPGHRRFQLRR